MRFCAVNHYAWNVIADRQGPGVHIGGEEVQHTLLTRYFARIGWEVTSVVGDFGQAPDLVSQGVRVRSAYDEFAGVRAIRFLHPRTTGLWAALKQANADVYYTSCAGPWVGVIAMFCKLYRRRFVFRIASDSDCDPKRLLVSSAKERWLYHYGLPRADAVLAQTAHQADLLQKNYSIAASVAGMFADSPTELTAFNSRQIDLLWLANLRALKRPQWFVELARELPSLAACMAGGRYPGAESLFDEVELAARQLPNFLFEGPVAYGRTMSLFSNSKVFVNTSELEGFPNTYLQAWAHGVPTVATFDPDGLVASRKLGIIGSSVQDLRDGVREILKSEASWQEYSHRCREYFLERFAPDKAAIPYITAATGSQAHHRGSQRTL